jgi:hypothetical protein
VNATGALACAACDKGTFQPFSGQTLCDLCAAGKFTPAVQQSACQDCTPGTPGVGSARSVCVWGLSGARLHARRSVQPDQREHGGLRAVRRGLVL